MKATSKSWKTQPLPAERARLKLERSFSVAEWDAVQLGFIPEEMEDCGILYFTRHYRLNPGVSEPERTEAPLQAGAYLAHVNFRLSYE